MPFDQRWFNLVTETQLATDLIVTGLRRISRLPMGGDLFGEISYDQTYPLYVGLHTFTSGLERLCKLTLACDSFLASGTFAPTRRFSHRITELLNAVEQVQVDGGNEEDRRLTRPADSYAPALDEWLERYATGSGRYELLDSLSHDLASAEVWRAWVGFCANGGVSDSIRNSISLNQNSAYALERIATANDLESVVHPYVAESNYPLSEESAAVVVALHRRARWVASILAALTDYTHDELPLLSEALIELRQTSDDFYAFEIARLSDPDVVAEELLTHAQTVREQEEDVEDGNEEDDDDDDE